MQVLNAKVAKPMSMLEKVFPPTCFDVMTHLVAIFIGLYTQGGCTPHGAVHESLKWVCKKCNSIEREHGNWVSIEEALGFCTEYIQDVKSIKGRVWDDKEEPTMHDEILEGNWHSCRLNVDLKSWAHTFVLHNATTTQPWRE